MAADAIGLNDLASGTARRGIVIASESALFIALQTAEALRDGPTRVSIEAIRLTSEGAIEVASSNATRDESGAMATIVSVCETLLRPPPASVNTLLERVRKGQVGRLDALCAELEALLVPLNRAAARRVLGRFVREHHRAGAAAPPSDAPTAAPPAKNEAPVAAPPKVEAPAPAKNETPVATTAKAESPPASTANALDTAPDAKPAIAVPLPGAAKPGQSALDTEPDAAAGIEAMLAHPLGASANGAADEGRVSHDSLENPRIPPPPPLGSLGDLAPGKTSSATETEPDAYAKSSDATPTASDTVIEGGQAKSRARTPGGDDDDGLDRLPVRRSGSIVVLAIAIGSLAVALVVLALALIKR